MKSATANIRRLALAIVVVLAVIAGLLLLTNAVSSARARAARGASATSTPIVSTLPDRTRPFAVMIDNHPDALPQSGIDQADLVFEAPVEGSLTRLMAVFRSATGSEIGPVRSARPYFLDWAAGLDAVYAHVGGSDEALTLLHLNAEGLDDANEFQYGSTFWRDTSRVAPHNAYTSTEKMHALINAQGWHDVTDAGDGTVRDAKARTGTTVTRADVIHDVGGIASRWRWDAAAHAWRRSQNGADTITRGGKPVLPETVVIMEAQKKAIDDPHAKGLIGIETIGGGKATVLRDGMAVVGAWHKDAPTSNLIITDGASNTIPFAPGPVWIDVILPNFGGTLTLK